MIGWFGCTKEQTLSSTRSSTAANGHDEGNLKNKKKKKREKKSEFYATNNLCSIYDVVVSTERSGVYNNIFVGCNFTYDLSPHNSSFIIS